MKPELCRMKSPPGSGSAASGPFESNRTYRQGREIVEFSVKGPIGVSANEEKLNNSGCAVLDLIFAAPSQVGELTFRNYYTMWLSILVKTKLNLADPGNCLNLNSLPVHLPHEKEEIISDWIVSIPKKIIMQFPHHEIGSQDIVSVFSAESAVEWKNLVAMRLILRQPSPVWKTFHVEEINVYKDSPRRTANKEYPAEALMILIKKQTLASLKWTPTNESLSQGYSGGYEFGSLPQP